MVYTIKRGEKICQPWTCCKIDKNNEGYIYIKCFKFDEDWCLWKTFYLWMYRISKIKCHAKNINSKMKWNWIISGQRKKRI